MATGWRCERQWPVVLVIKMVETQKEVVKDVPLKESISLKIFPDLVSPYPEDIQLEPETEGLLQLTQNYNSLLLFLCILGMRIFLSRVPSKNRVKTKPVQG